jgi:SPP1 family predicted phage head-tail adaptor
VITQFIRRVLQNYLLDTCTIQRATTAADAYGHAVETWAAVATVVCRILQLQRTLGSLIAEQEKGRTFYTLVVPYSADLRDGDRIVSGGVTYQVIQVDLSRTQYADKQAVIVR